LGLFNSIFHLGSSPAYFGFMCRPADRERHTLENILETKSYTINQVQRSFYKNAHQASAKYPRNISEFEKVNLTPEYREEIIAPFVKESTIKFGLELAEAHNMLNKNTIIIGQVKLISIPENTIDESGFLQLDTAQTIAGSGCDAYYETNFIEQLPYARPENDNS
ncbi:MAG: flavin reductase, partial [Candidatus Kapaibacterium sp.]